MRFEIRRLARRDSKSPRSMSLTIRRKRWRPPTGSPCSTVAGSFKSDGRMEIFDRPKTRFVAEFVGKANILHRPLRRRRTIAPGRRREDSREFHRRNLGHRTSRRMSAAALIFHCLPTTPQARRMASKGLQSFPAPFAARFVISAIRSIAPSNWQPGKPFASSTAEPTL